MRFYMCLVIFEYVFCVYLHTGPLIYSWSWSWIWSWAYAKSVYVNIGYITWLYLNEYRYTRIYYHGCKCSQQ